MGDTDYYIPSEEEQESLANINYGEEPTEASKNISLVRPERNNLCDPNNPQHYFAKKAKEQNISIKVEQSQTINDQVQINTKGIDKYDSNLNISKKMSFGTIFELNESEKGSGKVEDEIFKIINNCNTSTEEKADNKLKPSISLWHLYCYMITFWAPSPILSLCGMPKSERQMAWREKIGLISIIFYLAILVSYLTFGFNGTVCKTTSLLLYYIHDYSDNLVIHGRVYPVGSFKHPEAIGITKDANILYPPYNGNAMDASFLFQNVNGNCQGLITPRENSTIPHDEYGSLAWYYPCKLINQDGSSKPNFNQTEYYAGWSCHTSMEAKDVYYNLHYTADIYYKWTDLRNTTRNLVVVNGNVLDLGLLDWLEKDQINYPPEFDELKSLDFKGYDLSILYSNEYQRGVLRCLTDIARVGRIDSKSIGCITSDAVLVVSLIFILGVVLAKFFVACYFRWAISKKQGAVVMDHKTMEKYMREIDDWSNDMESTGPIQDIEGSLNDGYVSSNLETKSTGSSYQSKYNSNSRLFSVSDTKLMSLPNMKKLLGINGVTTMAIQKDWENKKLNSQKPINLQKDFHLKQLPFETLTFSSLSISNESTDQFPVCFDQSIIHPRAIVQPSIKYMPHDYPLIHTIGFVTCYSENEEGLRITLDSLATTDYPSSHKLLMVVCDGIIKGSGNIKTTPDIVLEMMDNFVVNPENVKPYSYIAVATGTKRHNMAKVYAGFYKYDDTTTPTEKQQPIPMITIVKCGLPSETITAKPGNRGKRDSQVILMSFCQKLIFNERMTELEYQLLKGIWQVTGLLGDMYELVLMVDADTKVYPNSLTHMVAEMAKDPLIMGLCGETKIVNKAQSWVTAIQVFEYYISHHQAKAFESVFGSVTCLPGCFSMYRIKSPKGFDGYWVPILANPDIVEHYSDNITKTLHKKNLLLLGEDRYLSSLMLKTFPKRKQVFVPKAACKTIVPSEFKVLLSQRRRWINSTVHNLFELLLIRDLCGTFCFSMQFVIGIELIGTLVLPLAICFTVYVIVFAIASEPTPVITLVILAVILGLPGMIVIITATRWSYILWMFIYFLALPIWNFILPVYAFWKFDDFSWGDTRTIAGVEKNGKSHDDIEGEFDHSMIKLMTWRRFLRNEMLSKLDTNKSN